MKLSLRARSAIADTVNDAILPRATTINLDSSSSQDSFDKNFNDAKNTVENGQKAVSAGIIAAIVIVSASNGTQGSPQNFQYGAGYNGGQWQGDQTQQNGYSQIDGSSVSEVRGTQPSAWPAQLDNTERKPEMPTQQYHKVGGNISPQDPKPQELQA
ncbi:hypothetical protein NM208_g4645 [Fusarium decemcellulare]|uniref:Uncharacterized protein n=1 Tax=Fusarium decemcellulare TaxID=57161 RepID=A0ACC1SJV4_9HYPO|nr:hypothetical protein NM208_g4645 [Fusarium decemcellulare]